MKEHKTFLYLYPQEDIVAFEIERGAPHYQDPEHDAKEARFQAQMRTARDEAERTSIRTAARKELADSFATAYKDTLNACIDQRYRQQGYQIVFALLDNTEISPVMKVESTDKTIHVGMDAQTHRTRHPQTGFPYPNSNYILAQLGNVSTLRIGGFHMWDCVERVARRAHEYGWDTLVDEDLTEFFAFRMNEETFRTDTYQGRKHLGQSGRLDTAIKNARKGKPWLIQI